MGSAYGAKIYFLYFYKGVNPTGYKDSLYRSHFDLL